MCVCVLLRFDFKQFYRLKYGLLGYSFSVLPGSYILLGVVCSSFYISTMYNVWWMILLCAWRLWWFLRSALLRHTRPHSFVRSIDGLVNYWFPFRSTFASTFTGKAPSISLQTCLLCFLYPILFKVTLIILHRLLQEERHEARFFQSSCICKHDDLWLVQRVWPSLTCLINVFSSRQNNNNNWLAMLIADMTK